MDYRVVLVTQREKTWSSCVIRNFPGTAEPIRFCCSKHRNISMTINHPLQYRFIMKNVKNAFFFYTLSVHSIILFHFEHLSQSVYISTKKIDQFSQSHIFEGPLAKLPMYSFYVVPNHILHITSYVCITTYQLLAMSQKSTWQKVFLSTPATPFQNIIGKVLVLNLHNRTWPWLGCLQTWNSKALKNSYKTEFKGRTVQNLRQQICVFILTFQDTPYKPNIFRTLSNCYSFFIWSHRSLTL